MDITFYVLLFLRIAYTIAGSVSQGGPCSAAHNRLEPSSHTFLSECTESTFCSAAINGTCMPRNCRRDDFPFHADSTPPPPLCAKGFFCPDEGSGCTSVSPPGGECQLNRDEQCLSPPGWIQTRATAPRMHTFNGSICLHSICMYANVTFGQPCIIENTTYIIEYGNQSKRQKFKNTVSRHNCHPPELYCDPNAGATCQLAKFTGADCSSDMECMMLNCADNGKCADPPGLPTILPPWTCTVIGIGISSVLIAICCMLMFIHRWNNRTSERQLRDYYVEQLSLRKAIIQLHVNAAERILQQK